VSGLNGLPDFASTSSSAATFAQFGGGSYFALPQQLALAVNADGAPKFTLELIERFGDFSATGTYAVLDLSLDGDFQLDAALAAARSQDPGATVRPIAIAGGFARLYPTAGEVDPTSDVLVPVPLGLSGADYARWTTHLSAGAGELIKGAIAGGSLLLSARVEYDVAGVAPRVPATVEFEADALVTSLLAGKSGRSTSTADVIAAFTGAAQSLPLKILGGTMPPGDFAGAVASRLFAAFATLAPAPGTSDPPYVTFADPARLGTGSIQWDLSQPAPGRRQWVLTLDILTSLRAFVAKNGVASLVRNLMIPALQVGTYSIDFNANLPPNRVGVPAIGATVELAANPPMRPNSISETVNFVEPDDSGAVQFRLSPSEQLAYTLSGFAVVAAGATVQEYAMPPVARGDLWVELGADDFPVAFAHVTAADRLLSLATLQIVLAYTMGGALQRLAATLNAGQAGVALGMPRSATDATLSITATPIAAGPALQLAPMAPGRIDLDVTAFREFGPHRIAIGAALHTGDPALFLDLLAQAQEDAGAAPDQIFITADQPNATWGFVASSPFRAGYRYRTSAAKGAPAGAWSPALSPFTPLTLNADGSMTGASPTASSAAPVSAAI
jgi:hypothetical protein